jgi:hypothetical protein
LCVKDSGVTPNAVRDAGWKAASHQPERIASYNQEATVVEETAYLLQNQLNPFPIAGRLELDGDRLRFTLNPAAADANLGWLEKALGADGLKQRIKDGERPVVFDLDVSGRKISWPTSLARIGMKISDQDRNWLVSLDYPSSGAIWQTMHLIGGGKRSKPWKEALSAAGAA